MKTISPAEPQDDNDFEPDNKYRLTDEEIEEIFAQGEDDPDLCIDEEDIED